MTSSPFSPSSPFEADDADVAEQQRSATYGDDDAPPSPPTVPLDVANEADALEQGAEVGDDDEDYR